MSKRTQPWFVFAGGGTGGHIYPGLAIAAALHEHQPDCEATFFTTTRPIDTQLVQPAGHEVVPQPVLPWNPRPWKWPAFLKAYRQSLRLVRDRFRERKPAAVLGLGGYASAPAVMSASRMGVPSALLNPDAVPGRANTRLIRRVDLIFAQWDETLDAIRNDDRVRITGCPVRPEFLTITHDEGCKVCGLDPARHVVAITGASQGAATLNSAALSLAPFFAEEFPEWQIIHITGPGDYEAVKKEYARVLPRAKVFAFTDKMAWVMAAADLVISRAGASTLAELTVMGRPSILLPYPYDRRKHQMANAKVVSKAEGAIVIEDKIKPHVNAKALKPALRDLMTSHERRRRMGRAARVVARADAADAIAVKLVDMADTED